MMSFIVAATVLHLPACMLGYTFKFQTPEKIYIIAMPIHIGTRLLCSIYSYILLFFVKIINFMKS